MAVSKILWNNTNFFPTYVGHKVIKAPSTVEGYQVNSDDLNSGRNKDHLMHPLGGMTIPSGLIVAYQVQASDGKIYLSFLGNEVIPYVELENFLNMGGCLASLLCLICHAFAPLKGVRA